MGLYVRFKGEEQLFTKGKTILKKALKKIAQACLTYNGLEIPKHLNKVLSLHFEFNFTLVLLITLNFPCHLFNFFSQDRTPKLL
jgi:hypothetical protein